MSTRMPPPTGKQPATAPAVATVSAPSRKAPWTQRAERSNMLMLGIMTWISLRLGRRAARVVLSGIAAYFLMFAPAARRASRQYLARALRREPHIGDSFRQFLRFASTIHDRVYLLNDRFDLFSIRMHGREVIEEALDRGEGVFMVGAHFGSFEVLRAISRQRPGLRVCMLMYEHNARKINAALHAINPLAAHDVIALGHPDSMLRLRDALDEGAIIGILADRSLHDDETVSLPFLGEPACWPTGPWRLAALLRRPVVMALGVYDGGNRYDVYFESLADFSNTDRGARRQAERAALATYVQRLQEHCARKPDNWFNFFDFWSCGARSPTTSTEREQP